MSTERTTAVAAEPPTWPSLAWETHTWTPNLEAYGMSRTARDQQRGPYQSAVVPLIAGRQLNLPGSTLALAEEASTAAVRFDVELGGNIAPFASILLRSESASSSRIENLTSGAKAIAMAELGATVKRNSAEIVGNVRATQAAVDLADRLHESTVLTMHEALMSRLHPDIAGKWRTQQVWIGGSSYGPRGADYVAPHHDRVAADMADLMAFTRRNDLPVLPQAAVAHAQFETIHPFPDGNGRTGRALLLAMLRGKQLTRNVTVPVSAGLLTDPPRYFAALTAYRKGDPIAIIENVATATFAAIENGRILAGDINNIRDDWSSRITARRDALAWRIVDFALRQPVFDADTVARELEVPQFSARRAIDTLAAPGIVAEFTGLKRNRMWQARDVLDALDRFADRAGRRRTG